MRIAVAGATGNIGARTVALLEREGHEVIRISRSLGVDLITAEGLDGALVGVDAVVDAISSPPISPEDAREYFGTTTRNLLAAEERAGVRHHVKSVVATPSRPKERSRVPSGSLGRGECLWDGLEELEHRFSIEAVSSPAGVAHLTFTRR